VRPQQCVCVCVCVCVCACVCVLVRACVRAFMRACMRACVHACMCVYALGEPLLAQFEQWLGSASACVHNSCSPSGVGSCCQRASTSHTHTHAHAHTHTRTHTRTHTAAGPRTRTRSLLTCTRVCAPALAAGSCTHAGRRRSAASRGVDVRLPGKALCCDGGAGGQPKGVQARCACLLGAWRCCLALPAAATAGGRQALRCCAGAACVWHAAHAVAPRQQPAHSTPAPHPTPCAHARSCLRTAHLCPTRRRGHRAALQRQ
jgi:hypothetical protein